MKSIFEQFFIVSMGLLSTLAFFSEEASSQTRYGVYLEIPIKDVAFERGWISFRNAADDNQIWMPQFQGNCDLTLLHAANERRDHCNNSIQVRIRGLGYWANGVLGIDQELHCEIVNDSWDNKCETSSASTSSSSTSSSTSTTSTSTSNDIQIVVTESSDVLVID